MDDRDGGNAQGIMAWDDGGRMAFEYLDPDGYG